MEKKRILVSACLVGWHSRYDGGTKYSMELMVRARALGWSLVPVCPEVLGGLGIPRAPAVIFGGDGHDVLMGKGRVIAAEGRDISKAFILGARKTFDIALKTGCHLAILKDISPSCGVKFIKNPLGLKEKGMGITAALLVGEGIEVECPPE